MEKVESEKKLNTQNMLKKLMKYLATTAGRQKLCRLVQYFCRLLATKYAEQYEVLISKRDIISSKRKKAQSLMMATAMSRKILRFGPSITCIKTVILNLIALVEGRVNQPLIIFVLKTFSSFFIGMFFVCDHYLWLFKMGLVNNDALRVRMEFLSPLGWFFDCITCIIKNSMILYKKRGHLLANKQIMIDFIRVLGDFVISYSFVKPGSVNGKTVGTLGTITSLIGIYQNWP